MLGLPENCCDFSQGYPLLEFKNDKTKTKASVFFSFHTQGHETTLPQCFGLVFSKTKNKTRDKNHTVLSLT